jgi:hypothetical protein
MGRVLRRLPGGHGSVPNGDDGWDRQHGGGRRALQRLPTDRARHRWKAALARKIEVVAVGVAPGMPLLKSCDVLADANWRHGRA